MIGLDEANGIVPVLQLGVFVLEAVATGISPVLIGESIEIRS